MSLVCPKSEVSRGGLELASSVTSESPDVKASAADPMSHLNGWQGPNVFTFKHSITFCGTKT